MCAFASQSDRQPREGSHDGPERLEEIFYHFRQVSCDLCGQRAVLRTLTNSALSLQQLFDFRGNGRTRIQCTSTYYGVNVA